MEYIFYALTFVLGASAHPFLKSLLRRLPSGRFLIRREDPSTVRSAVESPETRGEILARADELLVILRAVKAMAEATADDWLKGLVLTMEARLSSLSDQAASASEDLFRSVIRSHEAVCAAKMMDEKAAYGQDPAMYYTLAICGEAGEMGNKIVKSLRNGDDPEAAKRAVISELPDVFIYGAVLAHVLEIDLTRLVNEKVHVVIERAAAGYYGGPLPPGGRPGR